MSESKRPGGPIFAGRRCKRIVDISTGEPVDMSVEARLNSVKEGIRPHVSAIPNLDYSFVNGGVTQTKNREYAGDVDTLTVVKAVNDEVRAAVLKMVLEHVAYQVEHGFEPDWGFPIELATTEQVKEAANGRGLYIHPETGQLTLKSTLVNDYADSLDATVGADFAYWQYMLITNNGAKDLVDGSKSQFTQNAEDAIATSFLVYMDRYGLYDCNDLVNTQRLVNIQRGIFSPLEGDDKGYTLNSSATQRMLSEARKRGFIREATRGGIYYGDELREHVHALKRHVTETEYDPLVRVVDFQDMWREMEMTPDWYVAD